MFPGHRDGIRSLLVGAVLIAACATTPRANEPCRDTESCLRQQQERERAFLMAIAAEPAATRLTVERVATTVFVDRSRRVVYALTPELVAFELETGAVRWKTPLASGDKLWRAGRFLVVGSDTSKLPPRVSFVDPEQPARAATCTLATDAPPEAEDVSIDAFDRAGQPYVSWRSSWSYRGGTPPGPKELQRERDATRCGILRVDTASCATSPQPLRDFTRDATDACSPNSTLLEIPAAVASAPGLAWPERVLLAVLVEESVEDRCSRIVRSTLEARDATGAVKWKQPLALTRVPMCMPP